LQPGLILVQTIKREAVREIHVYFCAYCFVQRLLSASGMSAQFGASAH